jgi:hypothetical protein
MNQERQGTPRHHDPIGILLAWRLAAMTPAGPAC